MKHRRGNRQQKQRPTGFQRLLSRRALEAMWAEGVEKLRKGCERRDAKARIEQQQASPPESINVDATKLSNEDYRRYLEARGLQLPVSALNEHCTQPRNAQPLDPALLAKIEGDRKRAEALKREKGYEAVRTDCRTEKSPEKVRALFTQIGGDPSASELIRRGAMDHNPELFDSRLGAPTAAYYAKIEADRQAQQAAINKSTPGYEETRSRMAAAGMPVGGQPPPKPRPRSPNSGKLPPPSKKVDARRMDASAWAAYLQARGLSQPTP